MFSGNKENGKEFKKAAVLIHYKESIFKSKQMI